MFKRVALFIATNLAIILVLSIVLRLLGIDSYLDEQQVGINYEALLVFSLVLGFGGSFISLAMSKWIAKRSTGAQVIEQPRNSAESWLLATVERQAREAGIDTPEVAVYDSPEMNAFATGARRNSALVAVSTGLLRSMPKEEVEAVLAHEVSHVANGDMVTLTLVQGVVNTFVIFLSRIVGHFVDRVILRNESGAGLGYFCLGHRRPARARHTRERDRDVGIAAAGVPRRCGLRQAQRPRADDQCVVQARVEHAEPAAQGDGGLRYRGRQVRPREALYEPSADPGAYRSAASRLTGASAGGRLGWFLDRSKAQR